MRTNLLVLLSAVVALTMSACVDDTTVDLGRETESVCTVMASIEAMTRTTMDDVAEGGKSYVVWSSGDKIGVVTENGTIREATIAAASVGKVDASFTVSGGVSGEKYVYGFYPYSSEVKFADGKLTGVRLNPRRQFIKNTDTTSSLLPNSGKTFATNELHMAAKADANGKLVFRSSCGIVELQLTSSKKANFYNITLHSDSKELSDYGTVDMTASRPMFVPYHMAKYDYTVVNAKRYGTHSAYMAGADNNGKGINLNSDAPVSLFFVVPIGTYDDLEIQVACPSLVVTKKSSKSHVVKPNTILAFKAFDINAVSNVYSGGDVTDLSADGCAYTYLVPASSSPKKYKFTAKMLGDTKEFKQPDGTLIKDMGTSSYNYNTTFVYAEDCEGVISDLRREGDVVYFTASKPGNAIIMIGSTSIDRLNQFHIWVSDAKDQQLPGGHVFLDRNLGATYAPKSLSEARSMTPEQIWRAAGCLYQWGNPTPRPSMTPTYVPEAYASTAVGNSSWIGDGSWILHPWAIGGDAGYSMRLFVSSAATDFMRTRMYFNYYPCSKNDYTDSSVQVWWHGSKDASKDFRFGKNALWQATKTQFDPCPPGYRVPSKQEMADAFTNNGVHADKQYKIALGSGGQYYTYNDQFVFVSWSGLRKTHDATLFNAAFTDNPRCGWWFFEDTLKDSDDLIAKYNDSGCYFFIGANKDMYSEELSVGKTDVYPAIELRNSGQWESTYQTEGNIMAPATNSMRYPVNTGMGVRCVRDSKDSQSSTNTPSYDVDTETDF